MRSCTVRDYYGGPSWQAHKLRVGLEADSVTVTVTTRETERSSVRLSAANAEKIGKALISMAAELRKKGGK